MKMNINFLNLHPWFITGFTDGEGTFSIIIGKSKTHKLGFGIKLIYSVCAKTNSNNLLLLENIKNYLGVGRIYSIGNISRFEISNLSDNFIIRKHFDKYPLQSTKIIHFQLWCKVMDMILNKEHLTESGFYKILAIKNVFPKGLSPILKKTFSNIPIFIKPQFISSTDLLNPHWIAGFVQADGNFDLSIIKSGNKLGITCNPKFRISQHSRDLVLLTRIMKYFLVGKIIKPNLDTSVSVYYIAGLSNLNTYIIPFFNQYSLYGTKVLDFKDFSKGIKIMKLGGHLTESGLVKLKKLLINMNNSRLK